MTVIVGADAGGTKTVAAVSVDGQEVARVTGRVARCGRAGR
jgi:N-acetylglucosamine kinase-like BadF-type ATPase